MYPFRIVTWKYVRKIGIGLRGVCNMTKLGLPGMKTNSLLKVKKFHTETAIPAIQNMTNKFVVGAQYSGFLVKQVKVISELQMTAIHLEHISTGADFLHIDRDDSNNVFCVGFRTTPMDSTGVPHILEHLVLCGSKKYPCRDPFFKMLNRSLSTFMNAMTSSDFTIYPFSTQNQNDYKNLMEVYLDAVFYPCLTELDFFQEGWRLEHENVDDRTSSLIFKGVVFNEMKGVFADSQQWLSQKLQNELLPSHTYGHISGGDPLKIPELSWKKLRDFHTNHYHPSNCRFFTYGNFPLEEHLTFVNNEYLSKFEKLILNTKVPNEPRWSHPRKTHINCGIDPLAPKDRQSCLAVSFLLSDIVDINENFILSLISELLIRGPNAPFYKTLIETEFGFGFTPGSGFDGSTRNTSFSVGLQGIDRNHLDKVVDIIDKTFGMVIEEGFPAERVNAILHNIELGIKHQTTAFGLNLAMNLAPLWNHGGDIIGALEINKRVESFKKLMKDHPYILQEKVKKYFKNNTHKMILSMSPDSEYENCLKKSEKDLLESKTTNLTDIEKTNIFNLGQVLKSHQEANEDISCLPTLLVSDIPKSVSTVITSNFYINGNIPLQLCEQPTNGVTYFRLLLDTKETPVHLREYIPLFCDVLTKMGAGELDFRSFSQKVELVSGGFETYPHTTEHPENSNKYEEGILLSSYCLHHNMEKMLDLWSTVFNSVKFDDVTRFSSLVRMLATEEANNLIHNGHKFAMSYAASSVNFISHLREQWSGMTQMKRLRQLAESEDFMEPMSKLQELANALLCNSQIRIAVNTIKEGTDDSVKLIEKFLRGLKSVGDGGSIMTELSEFSPYTCKTHHVFPYPVNYLARSFPTLPYSHPDTGSLRVLGRLMFKFLHREIREKGGAYGGGALMGAGGPFSFYSYRDPNSTQTLKVFDEAVEWILDGEFTEQDMTEAKLGVFQKVDEPVSPGSQGIRQFLYHISDSMFSAHRTSIIDTDSHDIVRVCRTYLNEAEMAGSCLIGPQNESIDSDPFWIKVHS